ncbi:succinate--hydroxymethylglutarate CoA-transferase-like [Octopus vulgaris]|uniref:Succinate--hydroxymethylglutarate CoA-transferase-like n=1 Tax=Octopus vulgaris TaxID=6645 RepID=A0AA36B5Z8_OCTVU|nr:succinate--hydroxymethylglutarate CoA-transferase-like [Octopus vulgaris]
MALTCVRHFKVFPSFGTFHPFHVRYCSGGKNSSRQCRQQFLSGVRIIDLTRILAGPYCTMILADMGAEVIKVERPGCGDDTRTWGPPFRSSESTYFLSVNRNKKSIAVDIKTPEGKDLIRKLAQTSDVLVENYLPGKLTEMGLGYSEMAKIAPHLIYCSITGYGQSGPYAKRPGYDIIVAGIGGLINATGPKDGEPCKVGVAMTDLATGLYAHGAILAALLTRQKTGKGQFIDCNLLSTQVASLVNLASNYLNAGLDATRHGTAHQSIVPYQAFSTSDGYLLVGANNDNQFKALCKVLQAEDLYQDDRFKSNQKRVLNRDVLIKRLSEIFGEKTTDFWLEKMEGCNFSYGPINNLKQVFNDQQVKACGLIQEIDHPTIGKVRLPAPAVEYSCDEGRGDQPTAPPLLGQHTREILQDILSLSHEDIKSLLSKGIVECAALSDK